jgi:hypothetical protein
MQKPENTRRKKSGKIGFKLTRAKRSRQSEETLESSEKSEELQPPIIPVEQDVETLLDIPGRKPLPQIPQRKGRKCTLIEMIIHNPDRYSRLITHIRAGVSFNVAAEANSIGERTFYEWGQRGQEDLDKGMDTFFSRFFRDVRRAAAMATADCESEVKALEPRKWLSHGPGRIFGGAWGAEVSRGTGRHLPAEASSSSPEIIDAPFQVRLTLPSPAQAQENKPPKHQTLEISEPIEYAAFQVLEDIGAIQISQEFKNAMQQQQSETEPTEPIQEE